MNPLPLLLATALPLLGEGLPRLRVDLGRDPTADIQLTGPDGWSAWAWGLPAPARPRSTHPGEATVEVWDLALRESPRDQTFGLARKDLEARLLRAWQAPPPSHGTVELSEFMAADPGQPQKLDLTKAKSLQQRFNRLPPNGSPVRP